MPSGADFATGETMNTDMPGTAREVRLASAPDGLPVPGDFTLVEVPAPKAGADEVLVRNLYFLVFPGLRTLIGGDTPGAPR
jgi:NADPH-dependent curcumin reductase CurA